MGWYDACLHDLHEVVDGDAANSSDPGLHVAQTNVEVLLDALLGDASGNVHVQQVVLGDPDVLSADKQLVGGGHVLVEDFGSDAGESRVGNPCAVMAGTDLAQLVSADVLHSLIVCLFVVLDGDLGSHATHGVDTTLVAGLNEELDVGIHEGNSHGDGRSVGENKVGVVAELLDGAEDVVPATAVETRAVLTELIDDLVHLEGSKDGLDQDSASDGAARNGDVVLGQVEGVVPQTSLEVALHLGQVKVRSEALLLRLNSVVEEVQAKVEETAGDGLAINKEVLLLKVPASGADNQGGEPAVSSELVFLGTLLEVHLATNSVVQVDLAVDHVVPCRGTGVWSFAHQR